VNINTPRPYMLARMPPNVTNIAWAVRLSWLENVYSCPLFGGRS